MKNQYFGDVDDYLKYGILRCLAGAGWRPGVCWMLTPDDTRTDGRRTAYLADPRRWRAHDPALFDALAAALGRPDGRDVRRMEEAGLLPGARFFRDPVPEATGPRHGWLAAAHAALHGADLIFFDPDNGLEVRSVSPGRRGSSRYLYWHEVEATWRAGASLLLFQHFPREPRGRVIPRLTGALAARTPGATVTALVTPSVLFLLASRAAHRSRLERARSAMGERWAGRVSIAEERGTHVHA